MIGFRSVTEIDVSNNQIKSLSTSLRKMGTLTSLKVGKNHLTSLPQPFGFLRSLKEVDLSDNDFEDIIVLGAFPKRIKLLKANGNTFKSEMFLKYHDMPQIRPAQSFTLYGLIFFLLCFSRTAIAIYCTYKDK